MIGTMTAMTTRSQTGTLSVSAYLGEKKGGGQRDSEGRDKGDASSHVY